MKLEASTLTFGPEGSSLTWTFSLRQLLISICLYQIMWLHVSDLHRVLPLRGGGLCHGVGGCWPMGKRNSGWKGGKSESSRRFSRGRQKCRGKK